MPYVFALFEAVAFTVTGVVATMATAVYSPLKELRGFAWRMWLWGSVGFVVGNALLLAFLFPFLSAIGIAGGGPPNRDLLSFIRSGLILFGPVLFSSAGVILGCLYGWRVARRRRPQLGV